MFSTRDKQRAVMTTVVVGGLVLWSFSRINDTPLLAMPKDAVPRTEGQKSGFPKQEDLPNYQPATLSNEGETPSYSQTSNFGK